MTGSSSRVVLRVARLSDFILAAIVVATAASVAGVAIAQETASMTPPPDWLRQPVDPEHARLAPHALTIGKWMPLGGGSTALYFAVGDPGGASLDAYARRVVAALPAGAANVSVRSGTACKGTPARLAAYDLPVGVHVEETIAVGETAAAVVVYVRPANAPPDPLAMRALASLCPQSE